MANRDYVMLEDKNGKEVLPVTDGNGVFVEGGTKKLENKLTEIDSKTTVLNEQLDKMTNNFITIEDFGGVADGVTDCTISLQNAINQAILEQKVLKLKGKLFIDKVTIDGKLSIISDKAEIITSSHNAIDDKTYKPIITINSNDVNISDLIINSTADSVSYLDYYNSVTSTAKCSNRLAFEVNGNNINISNVVLNNVYGIRDYRNSNCNYNNIVINGCEMGIFEYATNNNIFSDIKINMNDTGLNKYYHPYYFKSGTKNITINNTIVISGTNQIRDVFHFNDSDDTSILMENIIVNGAVINGNFLRLDQLRKIKNVVFNNVSCTIQEYIHINGVDVSDITFNSCDIKIQTPTGSVIQCEYDGLNMILNHCKITFITNPNVSLFESVGITLNNCTLKCVATTNKFTLFKPLSNNRELVMNGGKIIAPNGLALINGSLTDKVIINNVYFNVANQTAQYIAYVSATSNWYITNCVFNTIRSIFQDGVSTTSKNINNTVIS